MERYYNTLHYTTLHYTSLHYTTLHYTTLHHTTPHNTTLYRNPSGPSGKNVAKAVDAAQLLNLTEKDGKRSALAAVVTAKREVTLMSLTLTLSVAYQSDYLL